MDYKWKTRIVALLEILFSLAFLSVAIAVISLAFLCSSQLHKRTNEVKLDDGSQFSFLVNGTTDTQNLKNTTNGTRFVLHHCTQFDHALTAYMYLPAKTVSLWIMALIFVTVLVGPLYVNLKLLRTAFTRVKIQIFISRQRK